MNNDVDLINMLSKAVNLKIQKIYDKNAKYNNQHFIGLSDKNKLFIKILENKKPAYTEIAVSGFLDNYDIPHPKVVDWGEIEDQVYIVYEWNELNKVCEDKNSIEAMAKLLKKMHSIDLPKSENIRRQGDLFEDIRKKIEEINSFDKVIYNKLLSIYESIDNESCALNDCKEVLLHGDFGYRNIALNEQKRYFLFDFEHAGIGNKFLDFGKIWDREIDSFENKKIFLSYYFDEENIDVGVIEKNMMPVRLWIASGIFCYANKKNDREFEAHGFNILKKMEQSVKEIK